MQILQVSEMNGLYRSDCIIYVLTSASYTLKDLCAILVQLHLRGHELTAVGLMVS